MYKYFSPDVAKKFLESLHIRFTSPKDFNDPFEAKPIINEIATEAETDDIFREVLDKEIQSSLALLNISKIQRIEIEKAIRIEAEKNKAEFKKSYQGLPKYISKSFEKETGSQIGILCLTEKNNNLLMWSHYAESHKGICVEFDTSNPFFNQKRSDKDDLYHLRKIDYRSTRPLLTLTKMSAVDCFLTKSNHWEYEQEWRMVVPLADADKQLPLPSQEIIHLFKVPSTAIKAVYLGSQISTDLTSSVIKALGGNSDLHHVSLYASQVSKSEYKLDFHKIR